MNNPATPYRAYVASGLDNIDKARELIAAVRKSGIEITYDWTLHGSLHERPDQWSIVSERETNGVLSADALIALMPGGNGTHVEIGLALAACRRVIIIIGDLGGRVCIFHHHPRVMRVSSIDDAIDLLIIGRNLKRLSSPKRDALEEIKDLALELQHIYRLNDGSIAHRHAARVLEIIERVS